MTFEKTPFGQMPDGTPVFKYTFTNINRASFSIINYGAIIQSLKVPDRNGTFADVVLGYDHLDGYLDNNPFFGAIVGRYGNRIRNGRFELNGKTIQLAQNDGEQHLHGGTNGFDKKFWELTPIELKDAVGAVATLESPDGDENYPGTVVLKIQLSLTNENELRLEYLGETDQPTLLNPTHHSYFNLSGDLSNSVEAHTLQIDANGFTPVDSGLIPIGEISDVTNTPMDFRTPVKIAEKISNEDIQLRRGGGFDHNFALNDFQPQKIRKVAFLADDNTGRTMEVYTDQPGMQLYTGNNLDGTIVGKEGVVYGYRCGVCLEAQHFPDSPNQPQFPSTELLPDRPYRQFTSYKFGIK